MQWLIDIVMAAVCPPGMIMLWHSTVATIPSGWHLCDGTAGTPNLRNKFIPCVTSDSVEYIPHKTGGSVDQTHTFTGDGHFHTLQSGDQAGWAFDNLPQTDTIPAVGETDVADRRPPYHALCYIMKL